MFNDYHHRNKTISLNDKKIVVKYLSDRDILNKEFTVLQFLKKEKFVPKVHSLKKQSFFESFIDGKHIDGGDLSESIIKELARLFNRLHSIEIPEDILLLIKNDLLVNDKYYPSIVFKKIVGKSNILDKTSHLKLEAEFKLLDQYINSKPYALGLIHGDLNTQNIFVSNDDSKIILIDWTDCRFDIVSCDIAQLFYSLRFDDSQIKLFLENYNQGYIDKRILIAHQLLLVLYDLFDSKDKDDNFFKKANEELKRLISSLN